MMAQAADSWAGVEPLVWMDLELNGLREAIALPTARLITKADQPTPDQRARVRVMVTGGMAPVAPTLLDSLPNLELIVAIGAGHNGIDLADCRARGIRVTSSIGVNARDVADVAVGSLIALVRDIVVGDRLVRSGGWQPRRLVQTRAMSALRVGVFGLGSIGRAVASRLEAFGCAIAWCGPNPKDVPWQRFDSLLELADRSDVLVVTAPLSPQTQGAVSRAILEALGPGGYLVNVGRGDIVDEDVLIEMLRSGQLAGAALDVFAEEPTPPERWRDIPNTVLTPHLGGVTFEAVSGVLTRAGESTRRGLAGGEPEVLVA